MSGTSDTVAGGLPPELRAPGDMGLIGRLLDGLEVAGCVIDAGERLLSWNATYELFFPEHRGLLRVGWPYVENLRNFFRHNLVGVSEERWETSFAAGIERHRTLREPSTFQKLDGRFLRSQAIWFADGSMVKHWSDVSAGFAADSEAVRIAELVTSTDLAAIRYDGEERFRYAHRRAGDLLPGVISLFHEGATYRDHLRRIAETELDPSEAPRLAHLAERPVGYRHPLRSPLILKRRGGGWLRLEEHATRDRGLTVLWTDITQQKGMEDANELLRRQTSELAELAEALKQARDEALAQRAIAEEANRAKSAFLAVMSHELRTPLNAIIGFSEILAQEKHGPLGARQYADYVESVRNAGNHLLSLVNDVLDLSKIEAGLYGLRIETVDLAQAARGALRMVEAVAAQAKVRLELETGAPEVPIRADGRAVKQMLVNLLANGCKFTKPGGGVRLSLSRDEDGWTRAAVRDTGIGMTADDIAIALEPFRQVDSPLTRSHAGTGLGLPIVKRLIELHGGRLEIASEPGDGTTVMLAFPPAREARPAAAATAP